MVIAISPADVALWLSSLTVLIALVSLVLLPKKGPMKMALNRHRAVAFAQAVGITFALFYAAMILGLIP